MIQWNHSSHARESKTVLDSGFRAVELGFPILIVYNDFGFLELYSGFQSPGFWNPQGKSSQLQGFHKQKFIGLRNPHSHIIH